MSRPVHLPKTLDEVFNLMEAYSGAVLYSGGTDLLVRLKLDQVDPPSFICLERVGELKGAAEQSGKIRVGAGTTFTEILNDPLLQKHGRILVEAAKTLGSPPIRHMGTIGGNICTASPAGDSLPPLTVLAAELEIASKKGVRREPLGDFIRGPGRNGLQPGEILYGISFPKARDYNIHHFEKVGLRNALACSVVSLAALVKISSSGAVERIKLAWGSVGPTVVTLPEVEALLTGRKIEPEILARAVELIREGVSPIDDVRASADYRRKVAGNLIMRLLLYTGSGVSGPARGMED